MSPTRRATRSASPVRIDSSIERPRASTSSPSATTWSPGCNSTMSSGTNSSASTERVAPSRRTVAWGAISSAKRSSVCLARNSWAMPINELITITAANSASCHAPAATIKTMKPSVIRLINVKTLRRRIARSGMLVASLRCSPRARRFSSACAVERPACAAVLTYERVTGARGRPVEHQVLSRQSAGRPCRTWQPQPRWHHWRCLSSRR